MKKLLLLLVIFICLNAQSEDEWELITRSGHSVTYMEKRDLSGFKGNDVYVWVMEKHNPPIIIESVDGRIYKTKTYYLFSKEYQRYSMIQIIYYDEKDNVLKSFDYSRKTDIPTYKYNFPIMRGSTEEVIFQKIVKLTGDVKKETNEIQ
ncbi:MAG: hypothetical protein QY331_10040 [Melioribacteraceae bacterium]|nr:MAG: hypothetical protein QY331_10040 [Melioribacteraceae bacterium]